MARKALTLGMICFFIMGSIGLLLRVKMMAPLLSMLKPENLLHAHSHVAILGWVYLALVALILRFVIKDEQPNKNTQLYLILWLTFAVNIGMAVSFSLQGYGIISIIFSTFMILLSYWFAAYYFQADKNALPKEVLIYFHTGVLLMLLSSLGPWTLAFNRASGFGGEDLYHASIYFYLHFQYNGWFTYLILGTIYAYLHHRGVTISRTKMRQIWILLSLGLIPSYIPAILWLSLPSWLQIAGVIGVLLTISAIFLFVHTIYRPMIREIMNKYLRGLFQFSILSLLIRSFLEMLGSIPPIAHMIFNNRSVIIGYLHLVLLAFVTSYLFFGLFQYFKSPQDMVKWTVFLFIPATFFMVVLIFLLGLFQWIHLSINIRLIHQLLSIISALVLVAGIPAIAQIKKSI